MNYPKQSDVIYLDKESPAMAIRIKRAAKPIPKHIIKKMMALDEWTEKNHPHAIDFIDRVYSLADEFMNLTGPYTVCQKGCSACCNMTVTVSAMEAGYIAEKAGMTLNPFDSIIANKDPIETFDGEPCPFLNQDKKCCSIYEYRPLSCRMFAAFDHPKYCQSTKVLHSISTAYNHPYFRHIQDNLSNISLESLGVSNLDIREWFNEK